MGNGALGPPGEAVKVTVVAPTGRPTGTWKFTYVLVAERTVAACPPTNTLVTLGPKFMPKIVAGSPGVKRVSKDAKLTTAVMDGLTTAKAGHRDPETRNSVKNLLKFCVL